MPKGGKVVHGHAIGGRLSPEYVTWRNIRARCADKSNPFYGGRGIYVCDRWESSFANFLSDMGCRPSPLYSIERINNDEGYTPWNCVWADEKTQQNNRRQRRKRTHCKRHHELTPDNLIVNSGRRLCKKCDAIRRARSKERLSGGLHASEK